MPVAGATERIRIGIAAHPAPLCHSIAAAQKLASLETMRRIAGEVMPHFG